MSSRWWRRSRWGLAFSSERLLAVGNGGASRVAWRALPAGVLEPSSLTPNIHSVSDVARLAAEALSELGAKDGELVMALPDLALVTTVFPPQEGRARTLKRARRDELAKRMPFPVEESRMDFWTGSRGEALGVAIRTAVVRQYEQIAETTGCRLGWVDGTSLAKLPNWAVSAGSASGLSVQLQLYPPHYVVSAFRDGELMDVRTRLRAPDDLTEVRSELLRLPALYHAASIDSLVVSGALAEPSAEWLAEEPLLGRVHAEAGSEEAHLQSALEALLERERGS